MEKDESVDSRVRLTAQLPTARDLYLYIVAGGQAAAFLHLARTVCRRAERSVTLQVSQGACDPSVAVYLNRLSDYLFTVARVASRKAEKPEITYKKS